MTGTSENLNCLEKNKKELSMLRKRSYNNSLQMFKDCYKVMGCSPLHLCGRDETV